jgi:hypothetical protein
MPCPMWIGSLRPARRPQRPAEARVAPVAGQAGDQVADDRIALLERPRPRAAHHRGRPRDAAQQVGAQRHRLSRRAVEGPAHLRIELELGHPGGGGLARGPLTDRRQARAGPQPVDLLGRLHRAGVAERPGRVHRRDGDAVQEAADAGRACGRLEGDRAADPGLSQRRTGRLKVEPVQAGAAGRRGEGRVVARTVGPHSAGVQVGVGRHQHRAPVARDDRNRRAAGERRSPGAGRLVVTRGVGDGGRRGQDGPVCADRAEALRDATVPRVHARSLIPNSVMSSGKPVGLPRS